MSSDETKRFEEGVKSIWENTSFTDAQRRAALSVLSSTFNKSAFINIVEEPEQNLFPSSQWQMMKSLLAINNSLSPNKLIITTHSPYLINVFTIAVKAGLLINKVKNKEELNEIYPTDSVIYPNDIVIYELDENKGIVAMLEDYDGLPSDENSLNNFLEESNDIFANLLEIQQKL